VSAIETISISNTTTAEELIHMSLTMFKFTTFRTEDFALWELNTFGVQPLHSVFGFICMFACVIACLFVVRSFVRC